MHGRARAGYLPMCMPAKNTAPARIMREMQEPCQPSKQTGLYSEQTDLYNEQTDLYGIPPAPLIQTGLSIYFLGGHMRI